MHFMIGIYLFVYLLRENVLDKRKIDSTKQKR